MTDSFQDEGTGERKTHQLVVMRTKMTFADFGPVPIDCFVNM